MVHVSDELDLRDEVVVYLGRQEVDADDPLVALTAAFISFELLARRDDNGRGRGARRHKALRF